MSNVHTIKSMTMYNNRTFLTYCFFVLTGLKDSNNYNRILKLIKLFYLNCTPS